MLLRAAALVGVLAMLTGCGQGEHQGVGEITPRALAAPTVASRVGAVREVADRLAPTPAPEPGRQILFGDLHVHTTFSSDAYLLSLPMMGGDGAHPPADACDFARFCAQLDFWSINDHAESTTPTRWRESIEAIRQCNDVAGDTAEPDLISFAGWEWSQVGTTPEDHYGHKNVVLLETDTDKLPRRAIAAPREGLRVIRLPRAAGMALPLLYFSERQQFFDYTTYADETAAVPLCEAGIDTRELPDDCHEVAATPSELHARLDQWNTPSLVIPHGTTWGLMTPAAFDIAAELTRGEHEPDRQRLIEIYSGHGSAEEIRAHRAAVVFDDDQACPAPDGEFLACCWRAGEIIEERCEASGEAPDTCDSLAAEARTAYLAAAASGHRTVPGATVEDWQDCDQCRDCFMPAYSHRPGGSAQRSLTAVRDDAAGDSRRMRFGFIGSSDTHDARAGNGFKEFGRIDNTEAPYLSGQIARFMGDRREPAARAERLDPREIPLQGRRYTERGASFLTTGGLAAVHSPSRRREDVFAALARRETYATSGSRMLLWFDLVNAPDADRAPMGAEVGPMSTAPRFRVAAQGAFVQKPGCPADVIESLGDDRVNSLCLGECYHPGDERHPITRIEVVRVRPALVSSEDPQTLVDDPWQSFECPADGTGCAVEFEDPEYVSTGREVAYYVRALQAPTPMVNGANLRCEYDASGRCIELTPCYGDERTARDDDCLADAEEHAWSSPIWLEAPATGSQREQARRHLRPIRP